MNLLLVGFGVSIALGVVSFFATENYISALLIILFSNLFFIFHVRKKFDRYHNKVHRYHQCYQFINSYLISLSIKGSMNAAFASGYEIADQTTKEIIDSIHDLNEEEKVAYLAKHFKFDLFRLFLDTVSVWNEEGGDILQMSQHLMNQVRLKEEYLLNCQKISRSKLFEFIILWSITLSILMALRFALSQFFSLIIKAPFYQIAVVVLIAFVIVSLFLMVNRITNVNLEGWKEDEKQS